MFLKFKTFVSNLAIVNDSCERAVKTAADFATKYQHNETEFQHALLVINQARKKRPNTLKSSFSGPKAESEDVKAKQS
jgi:mRNA-degrading endonuclease HigB of HigAB toxin-antitoxin module